MKAVLEKHMSAPHYVVELFKANPGRPGLCDGSCATCAAGLFKAVRMPAAAWQQMRLLPDPQPASDGSSWLPYERAVGKAAAGDQHRPSRRQQLSEKEKKRDPALQALPADPASSGVFVATNARTTVRCSECNMLRVVFAKVGTAAAVVPYRVCWACACFGAAFLAALPPSAGPSTAMRLLSYLCSTS